MIIENGILVSVEKDDIDEETGLLKNPISDKVTSIGPGAFRWCESLKHIKIPSNVTELGDRVFEFCKNLTTVEMPDNITSIGESAFAYCESLKSIKIPLGVKEIKLKTFYRL